MAEIYTTRNDFESGTGNKGFTFDSSGNVQTLPVELPVFTDTINGQSGNEGVIQGTSGIPEREAVLLIQKNVSYVGASGNFFVNSEAGDTNSDPFILHIVNDTASDEVIEFSTDTILYPSAISGETQITVPPGKTTTIERKANFEWYVSGTFSNSNLSTGGSTADIVTVDESQKVSLNNASVGVTDWATAWYDGIVGYDGTTLEAVDFNGNQRSSITPSAPIDNNIFSKENVSTYEQYLYSAESFYIGRVNLNSGTEESQFMDEPTVFANAPSSVTNINTVIQNNTIYIAGTSSPSSGGNLYMASYDLTQFSDGASNVTWDQANEVSLTLTSESTTSSADIYSYEGELIVTVDFGNSKTEFVRVDSSLQSVSQSTFTSPDGQDIGIALGGFIYKFGERFQAPVESSSTGDQWVLAFDKHLTEKDWAPILDPFQDFETYNGGAVLPGAKGEIYLVQDDFVGANTPSDGIMFKYANGKANLVDRLAEELHFQTDTNPSPNTTVYTPTGIWVSGNYGGSGSEWAPLDGETGRVLPATQEENLGLTNG